ncbi:RNA ligase, DRB0094 family [Biscogniauxia mediterranea]|nr:RNA ligase, DRB0094 family [Biscogniauxia mediterranea]
MVRKLVSIRRIAEVRPIRCSSRMEMVLVDGWTCAVRAGSFDKDEIVVFFEIDSFLPPPTQDPRYNPAYNPLHHSVVNWQGQKGIHVKSVMVHNSTEISQGIVLKLEAFPEIRGVYTNLITELGPAAGEEKAMAMCFAEKLGVKKWKLPDAEAGVSLGQPPVCFPKTDMERVQNIKTLFTPKYSKAVFQESVKMDGSSMTVYYVKRSSQYYRSLPILDESARADMDQGRIGVCSRNHDLSEKAGGKFWDMALKYRLPGKLERVGRNIAIQGELVGSTICQNRHGFEEDDHDFFVYSIFDMDAQQYLDPREVEQRVSQLELKHVPVLGYVNIHDIASNHDDLLKRAEGIGLNGEKREGLVYKNVDDRRCFKVIANDYLLKHGE